LLHGTATRAEAEKRAVALFKKLSLPNPETIGERFPHQVSGGQLQRVMTAMALCSEPDLIVFDEPTTALDVTTQIDVLAAIKDAIRDTHVAALYITHDLAVVAQVSDEIMVLRHGRLVEWGGTRQIIKEPRQEYTNALVSVHEIEHQEQKPGTTPFLSVKNITAAYGGSHIKVLKNVSVDIYPGQTLAVVGESGSGKSTLARAITGLLPPEQGTVTFDGRPLANRLADRPKEDLRQLQMIYQMADVAMNPRQTVATIIGRPLEFYFGMRGRERDRRVTELLDKIEMGKGFSDRYPAELSGGQKQRVCIARVACRQAEADHLRRGDLGARSAGRQRHPEAAARAAEGGERRLPVHHPRPRHGEVDRRFDRGDVSRRSGALRPEEQGAKPALRRLYRPAALLGSGDGNRLAGKGNQGTAHGQRGELKQFGENWNRFSWKKRMALPPGIAPDQAATWGAGDRHPDATLERHTSFGTSAARTTFKTGVGHED
jgi:ABC-type dipeptide/oligopeptide/nickel transport system ATPase component